MVKLLLLALSTSLTFLFLNVSHPLAMGLVLLSQTFCIALLSGLVSQTFWLSYVLFLVLLGGMLVLFLYVTSLASNEMFSSNMTLFLLWLMVLGLSAWSLWVTPLLSQNSFPWGFFNLSTSASFSGPAPLLLTSFYNIPTLGVTLGLAWYLLLALLIVTKLISAKGGPLRPRV